ncbi:PREDICTED: codeine O-demethylase-like [Camelina sativa]|uniref:Codeine O-demethylase-like n=1 Tax=Camelina sativa TaxID=90675 RepID=A0ABM0UTX4_CAMSA|nr:PREDICTED: codeine O-demethylase-like [Camelina sativa]
MEKPKPKTVQEVVAAGERLPERYLYTPTGDGERDQPFNGSSQEMEITTIDLSLLLSSYDVGREELSKLHSALATWGVVQVMNHGITEALLDKIYELTKQFFALPTEEKQKYAREIGSFQGYGNDMILSDDQVLDWVDRLYLITYPEDQRQLKFWPKIPIGFRETLQEYTMKQQLVVEQFFKALARSLELEDNCFLEMHGENATMETRFNVYPPCLRPDKVLGLKPHSDGSAFTLLLPDKNVEGLQFLKDGKWYKASILPHTIMINVGDTMEIMSNGIYKSPVHRVVLNGEKERISVATFCNADEDKEIQPVYGLVSEARPRLYKAVKKSEKTFFDYYQQGRRPIEDALI